jgi:hypothetical protein
MKMKTVLKAQTSPILDVYVPIKRRQTLDHRRCDCREHVRQPASAHSHRRDGRFVS